MKTLIQLLKIVMLVTTLSFVMSCDKNNKRSSNNNMVYGNGYGYNNAYPNGQQQCNGNPSLFIWGYPDQTCASQPQQSSMGYGCWKSCAYTSCSGQVAYPSGSTGTQQGVQCM